MTEVCGRPVTGEISRYGRAQCEQWSGEKFMEMLDAVLNQPGIESVRWSQGTPSWNDGEPCTFGINEFLAKLADGEEDAGDNEDGFLDYYSLEQMKAGAQSGIDFTSLHAAGHALRELAISSGRFEEFLEESFGDPAEITATKDGFHVAEYNIYD